MIQIPKQDCKVCGGRGVVFVATIGGYEKEPCECLHETINGLMETINKQVEHLNEIINEPMIKGFGI